MPLMLGSGNTEEQSYTQPLAIEGEVEPQIEYAEYTEEPSASTGKQGFWNRIFGGRKKTPYEEHQEQEARNIRQEQEYVRKERERDFRRQQAEADFASKQRRQEEKAQSNSKKAVYDFYKTQAEDAARMRREASKMESTKRASAYESQKFLDEERQNRREEARLASEAKRAELESRTRRARSLYPDEKGGLLKNTGRAIKSSYNFGTSAYTKAKKATLPEKVSLKSYLPNNDLKSLAIPAGLGRTASPIPIAAKGPNLEHLRVMPSIGHLKSPNLTNLRAPKTGNLEHLRNPSLGGLKPTRIPNLGGLRSVKGPDLGYLRGVKVPDLGHLKAFGSSPIQDIAKNTTSNKNNNYYRKQIKKVRKSL